MTTRIAKEKKRKLQDETKKQLREFLLQNRQLMNKKNVHEHGFWMHVFHFFYGEYPKDSGVSLPTPGNPYGLTVTQPPIGSNDPRWDELLVAKEALRLIQQVIVELEQENAAPGSLGERASLA